METIVYTALALSGLSIAWNTFLGDHPHIKASLMKRSSFFVCGVCQLFWASLLVSFVAAPVDIAWTKVSSGFSQLLNWIVTWQSIAMVGYLLRYSFLLILESVKEKIKKNV